MVMQYGHGLLSDQMEITQDYLQKQGNVFGYVIAGTNWWGLDQWDVVPLVEMVLFNLTDFSIVPDRCQQGVVNQMALTRLLMGNLANDPALMVNNQTMIDPSRHYYTGNSLGGIMGGVLMAVSQVQPQRGREDGERGRREEIALRGREKERERDI